MSQENVETFKRSNDAFNRGEIDAWLEEFIDPEVEWHSALPGLLTQGGTVYRGQEGVREMLREIAEVLDEMTVEYSEIQGLGDRVVAVGEMHTRGRGSGVETEVPFAIVADYRNGKSIRVRTYRDPEAAFEAAGMSEQAMSQENVEVVRRLYERFNRGDIDALLQSYDPEVELYPGIRTPDQDTRYSGHQGMKEFFRDATEAWETVTVEPKELIECGGNRILTIDRWRFFGREGIEIDVELPTLFSFRDGFIVRIDGFTDKAEALEAAGLSEQAMSQENVELVRSATEAYIAGERDAMVDDFAAEDIEVCPDASRFPQAEPFRGREKYKRFLAEIDQGWEGGSSMSEIKELFPVGDRVVVRAEWGGRGKASGIDMRSSLTGIYTVRDGRCIKAEFFFDHAEALKAAGLEE